MTQDEITEKLAEVGERCKHNEHRLDSLDKCQKNIKEDVGELKKDIKLIEAKPRKPWENALEWTVLVAVGVVIGHAFTRGRLP